MNPGKVIEPITDRQRRVPNPKRKSRQQRINRKLAALEESEVSANSSSRRQLRLRASDKGLQFRPELVTQRAKDRIAEFLYALSQLPSEVQDEINRLQPELEKFGYQLKYIYNSKHSAKALFNDWELLPSINE